MVLGSQDIQTRRYQGRVDLVEHVVTRCEPSHEYNMLYPCQSEERSDVSQYKTPTEIGL